MSAIAFLIEQTAIGLYILIAAGLFWYWRKASAARYALRATPFELERDLARYQIANAVTAFFLLIEAALIVVGVQRVVAPAIRQARDSSAVVVEAPVDDDTEFRTPTFEALPEALSIDPSELPDLGPAQFDAVFIPPTLTPTPVGTILAAPPASGCDTPNAFLQVPANGMVVFQPVEVIGSAYVDNFSSYRLEIALEGESFAVFDTVITPRLQIGRLSQFNPVQYAEGTYNLRLTVFDTQNQLQAACMVTIYIGDSRAFPTETQIPTLETPSAPAGGG
jgi:hypothetical protein